jgi:cell division protein ZipA
MTELRWILLIAGIALIVALYVIGTRKRQRNVAQIDRPLRIDPPRPPPTVDAPRLEPRMSLEEGEASASGAGDDHDIDLSPSPAMHAPLTRRDTTAAARPEPQSMRPDRTLRPEPPSRAEPRETTMPRETVTSTQGDAFTRAEPRPASPRGPQKIVAIRVTAAHPTRFDGALLRDVVTAARFTHGRYEIFHRLDAEGRPIMSLASLLEPGTFDPAKMDSAAYPGIALFTVMPGPLPATRAFDELLDTARALAHRLGGQLQDDRGAPLSVQRVYKLREEVVAFERTLGSAGGA